MAGTIMLSVHPSRGLVDEKFRVEVENLPPACPVTLHCLHRSEDQDHWEAFGHYCSDHSGTVKGRFHFTLLNDHSGTVKGRFHFILLNDHNGTVNHRRFHSAQVPWSFAAP